MIVVCYIVSLSIPYIGMYRTEFMLCIDVLGLSTRMEFYIKEGIMTSKEAYPNGAHT